MQNDDGTILEAIPVIHEIREDGAWSDARLIGEQPDRIASLFAPGAKQVFAITEDKLLFSSDSGRTWRRAKFLDGCLGDEGDAECDTMITAISFIGQERVGWLALRSGVLYHSADDGITWRVRYKSSGPERVVGSHFEDMMFTDSNNGWARTMSGALFRTTDGGGSWARIPTPGIVNALSVLDVTHSWVVVNQTLYRLK